MILHVFLIPMCQILILSSRHLRPKTLSGKPLPPIRNLFTAPISVSQNSGIEKTFDLNPLADTYIHRDKFCLSTTLDLNKTCSTVKENSIATNNTLLPFIGPLSATEVCGA